MHATSGTSALSTMYWIQCPLCLLCLKWEIRKRKPVPPQSPEFHWRYTLLSPLLTPECWVAHSTRQGGFVFLSDQTIDFFCRNRQLIFFYQTGQQGYVVMWFILHSMAFCLKGAQTLLNCIRYNQMILMLLLLMWHKSIWSPAVPLWSFCYFFHNHKQHIV